MEPQLTPASYKRPAEAGRHQLVVLSWPGTSITYYDDHRNGRSAVKPTISAIAQAVAKFEPVRLLVDETELSEAQKQLYSSGSKVIHPIDIRSVGTGCPDIWMRDIGPTCTVNVDGVVHGVDFNFNGWGSKVYGAPNAKLARSLLFDIKIPHVQSCIVTEGGAIEVDGEGTLIASESSILNDNRNPGKTRLQIETELTRTLGIEKFIWVPGARDLDSTDFHIDAVARFVRPGVIFFASPRDGRGTGSKQDTAWYEAHQEARRILAETTDARGRRLEILDMVEPRLELVVTDEAARKVIASEASAGYRPVFSYVNYLLVKGGVIFPQFGDEEADAAALVSAQRAYPDREVVPVNVATLGVFGGGIHCVSQEIPFA